MDAALKTISIGMLGAGVVGSQVARLLQSDRQELSDRSGALLVLKRVGVRSNAPREGIDAAMVTTDLHSIVTDPEINIVIEVMGGIEPARTLISTHKMRLLGLTLGIQKIDASETQILLHFKQNTPVDPIRLIELVQKQKHIRFAGQDKLRIEIKGLEVNARYEAVRTLLRTLAG